jgi:ADP-ribose pyrophosphatase
MTLLGAAPSSAGLTSETVTFFQAGGLKKVAAGGGDASEDITVHETPLAEIRPWLELMEAEGKAIAALAYAGLYLMQPVPPADEISTEPTGPDSFRAL